MEVQGSDARPAQRVSSTKLMTSTTGHSTKLVRMMRREELLFGAPSTIKPQTNKDEKITKAIFYLM